MTLQSRVLVRFRMEMTKKFVIKFSGKLILRTIVTCKVILIH